MKKMETSKGEVTLKLKNGLWTDNEGRAHANWGMLKFTILIGCLGCREFISELPVDKPVIIFPEDAFLDKGLNMILIPVMSIEASEKGKRIPIPKSFLSLTAAQEIRLRYALAVN